MTDAVRELIEAAKRLGLSLTRGTDKVLIRGGEKDHHSPELVEAVKAFKGELLAVLPEDSGHGDDTNEKRQCQWCGSKKLGGCAVFAPKCLDCGRRPCERCGAEVRSKAGHILCDACTVSIRRARSETAQAALA